MPKLIIIESKKNRKNVTDKTESIFGPKKVAPFSNNFFLLQPFSKSHQQANHLRESIQTKPNEQYKHYKLTNENVQALACQPGPNNAAKQLASDQ